MERRVSIIMYHYVRELKYSRYPGIKGRSADSFRQQIKYIKKHYRVIGANELMDAVESRTALPQNALLLTFDDGYSDHFGTVFPILDEEKLPACFFPPAKCILENQVLDVNKIHFILACVPDKSELVAHINRCLDENRPCHALQSNEFYWQKCGETSRFDPPEVIFVKRMLQRELPEQLRAAITGELFRKFVTRDEKAFSKELYMSVEQISCLQRNGMYIGSHGFDHYWLDSLPEEQQQREIDLSLEFLESIGSNTERWIMCYPYGAFNASLLNLLEKRNCVVGLTTKVGIADLQQDNVLTLPRLDTNDLPADGG